ncbi:unnamed protein product [Gordionus sp. m RMFG-2023]
MINKFTISCPNYYKPPSSSKPSLFTSALRYRSFQSDGSHRYISNFSQVSNNILKYRYPLKSIPVMPAILQKAMFACKIDIKLAFFFIPLSHRVRKFVCLFSTS